MTDDKIIEYTSPNGYRGVIYGKASLAIYKPNGTISLQTKHREANTYEELKKLVDDHPAFLESLRNVPLDGGLEVSDRDCNHCKHYKAVEHKGDIFKSCSKWDCEFEKKED